MENFRIKGTYGEDMACKFLRDNGYTIIRRNYYIKGGEADIIALDNDTLCFIEVKMRLNAKFGTSFSQITKTKIKRLIHVARYFLYTNRQFENYNVRFDVVGIDGDNIELIKNAFDAY
ncbi:MAG: YraN family protein [Clostridiales bacterium]|nr:YraN family protein [Clostridiales bacterium]